MKHETRLVRTEQEQAGQTQVTRPGSLDFTSAEEAIRRDAMEVEVPPRVTERVEASIAAEPHPPAVWWKRLFKA